MRSDLRHFLGPGLYMFRTKMNNEFYCIHTYISIYHFRCQKSASDPGPKKERPTSAHGLTTISPIYQKPYPYIYLFIYLYLHPSTNVANPEQEPSVPRISKHDSAAMQRNAVQRYKTPIDTNDVQGRTSPFFLGF